jgi:bacterioferritin-associated ferredoxin
MNPGSLAQELQSMSIMDRSARQVEAAQGEPESPPNLRTSDGGGAQCGTCQHFMGGETTAGNCQAFGGYPCKAELVCDAFEEAEEDGSAFAGAMPDMG